MSNVNPSSLPPRPCQIAPAEASQSFFVCQKLLFFRRSSCSTLDLRNLNDSERARPFRVSDRAGARFGARSYRHAVNEKQKARIRVAHEKNTFTFCARLADGVERFDRAFA